MLSLSGDNQNPQLHPSPRPFSGEKIKNNQLCSAILSVSFPWESLKKIFFFCLSLKIENMNASLPKKLSKLAFWNVPFNVFYDFVFFSYLHSQLWMNFHAMHHFLRSLHARRNKNGKWYLLRENSFLQSPADAVGEPPSVCSAQPISLTLHRVATKKGTYCWLLNKWRHS